MADPRSDLQTPGATAPDWLPDPATLARMANAFFQALPGETPSISTAGAGGTPAPSLPAAPLALPVAVVQGPAPVATLPVSTDPHVPGILEQGSRGTGQPYFTDFASERRSFEPKPVPALSDSVPGDSELKTLLGGKVSRPNGFEPAQPGTSQPYFLQGSPKLPASPVTHSTGFSPQSARADFPILSEVVNGKPLIWLDNAATTHKPRQVIERLSYFYEHENSNIHRAAHALAGRATDAYEDARETVRGFINAASVDEIIFVRGTTEAINLVAASWGRRYIRAGDEIVITWLEHHANIVPWKRLADETGAILRVAPVDDNGDIILEAYAKLLGPRTKLVSLTQVSNALGTVTPAQLMVAMAHAAGARVLVDGAQSVSHMRTDVRALDADWFVFSGHKVFGPTGIGALYARSNVIPEMDAYQAGGNMIADVTFEKITYQPAPAFFEAGTGNIADAVGLGAALRYLQGKGIETVAAHEEHLIHYCVDRLSPLRGVRIVGAPKHRAGVVSFVMDGLKTEEVGQALSREGIAVRSGHHCAQPILRRFGLENSVRPSFALYNTTDDIDALIDVVRRIKR